MKLTEYKLRNNNLPDKKVFALVSDLHSENPEKVIKILKDMKPDYILAPGDIFEVMDGTKDEKNETFS